MKKSDKGKMTALHKRRMNAARSYLSKTGKEISRTTRASLKKWRTATKPRRSSAPSAPAHMAVPREPLTPTGRKVRLISTVAAVIGGLLSLVLPPLGSPVCIAGVVCAICARRIAARFDGDADAE